jgi:hypothetical protein
MNGLRAIADQDEFFESLEGFIWNKQEKSLTT